MPKNLLTLLSNATGEQRRQLRRGYEVALGAEFLHPAPIIAETRRIQSELHEAREIDATTSVCYLFADVLREFIAARCFFWRWRR